MQTEIIAANADAEKNPAVTTNISASEFALRRSEQSRPDPIPEKASEVPEEEAAPAASETDAEADSIEEAKPEEETPVDGEQDVLSQFDLDNLTPEQRDEIQQALGARSGKRIGELLSRAKHAEEELARLKAESQQEDPLKPEQSVSDNPFSDIDTIEALREKAGEVDALIEWAEDILDDTEGYSADEEVTNMNGQPMTRKQVRETKRNALKAKNRYLPDQLKAINKKGKSMQDRQAYAARAHKEMPWLEDAESAQTKAFKQLAGSPSMQKVYDSDPNLSAFLPYVFAHAVDSMMRGQAKTGGGKPALPKKAAIGNSPLIPPSAAPDSAAPSNSEATIDEALSELNGRFKKSGRIDDFIALRAKKFS